MSIQDNFGMSSDYSTIREVGVREDWCDRVVGDGRVQGGEADEGELYLGDYSSFSGSNESEESNREECYKSVMGKGKGIKRCLLVGSSLLLLMIGVFLFLLIVSKSQIEGTWKIGSSPEGTIENSESLEYSCAGTCYCNDVEERRIGNTLSRSIHMSVIAISTTLALNYALSKFESRCQDQFSSICNPKDVSYKVEFCEEGRERTGESEYYLPTEMKERWNNYREVYACSGHCVGNGLLNRRNTRPEARKASKEFNCRELKLSNVAVSVEIPDSKGWYFWRWDRVNKKRVRSMTGTTPDLYQVAAAKFVKEHLSHFCRAESTFRYSYEYAHPGRREAETRNSEVSLCVATSYGRRYNLRCSKIKGINKPD